MSKKLWQPLGGTSRRFQNEKTGETISRRQYDERFGKLKKQGFSTYEAKAKANKKPEQILKPARGRKSYTGPTKLKLIEIEARLLAEKERQARKLAARKVVAQERKIYRFPQKITQKNFTVASSGRVFETPIFYESIEMLREQAAGYKNVFAYLVGVNFINLEDNSKGAFVVTRSRDINMPYRFEDVERVIEVTESKSYMMAISAFVHVMLKIEYVREQREKYPREKWFKWR